ncbi:hypothetical protein K8R30_02755 [archaeon]|nr:hypothetical protein [archaeon]
MWYLDIFTNYTNGAPTPNTNITAWDKEGKQKFSILTNEHGKTIGQTLTEYTQTNSSETIYYSNYLINATTSEETSSQSVNISENRNLVFTFPAPISNPNGGGGGSSGSNIACIPEWECSNWGKCINKKQSRTCTDNNSCGIETDKPDTERKCKIGRNIKKVLFDINLKILKRYTDEILSGSIGLINIGIPGEVIANLSYKIKNSTEEIVYEEKETLSIETQTEFIKEINISNLPVGKYTWIIELTYEGQTEPALTQSNFVVTKNIALQNMGIIALFLLLIMFIITLVSIFFIRKRKHTKNEFKNLTEYGNQQSSIPY